MVVGFGAPKLEVNQIITKKVPLCFNLFATGISFEFCVVNPFFHLF